MCTVLGELLLLCCHGRGTGGLNETSQGQLVRILTYVLINHLESYVTIKTKSCKSSSCNHLQDRPYLCSHMNGIHTHKWKILNAAIAIATSAKIDGLKKRGGSKGITKP